MDILVEPSEYRFLNAGDSAMMEVAMSRLCKMFPEAHIQVLTSDPDALPRYSTRVSPLANDGRLLWLGENLVSSRFIPWQPELCQSCSRLLSAQAPALAKALRRFRYRYRDPDDQKSVEHFLNAIRKADLFVVAGMGGFSSVFNEYTIMLLDTLTLALAQRVPTVMLGQGIGPFDRSLESHARRVLRHVDYIALREGLHGPSLLRAWGIPKERWSVTGDDAIELAFRNRRSSTGKAIGVNLRVAQYSAVSNDIVAGLREPLQQIATRLGAPLRPVPISRAPEEDDALQVECILDGYQAVERPASFVDTPLRVIEEIQNCRIVVTGSYHAGVFALAQGIPVIGLVGNDYYQWKFDGLAHQFGDGCRVLRLGSRPRLEFQELIQHLWDTAPDLRPRLLSAAEQQQTASRAAYDRIYSLVGQRPANVQCTSR